MSHENSSANDPPTMSAVAALPLPGSDSLFNSNGTATAATIGPGPSYPHLSDPDLGFPSPGQRLGDFQVLRELGQGAFARVYLALQVSLNRQVALKVSANRDGEARALARLEHAHIVRVHDESVDWERNLRLMWMQYVPCRPLHQVIRALAEQPSGQWTGRDFLECVSSAGASDGHLDMASLRDIQRLEQSDRAEVVSWLGACLAEALAHAHGRGIIHRDVKPANILISTTGRPLLADFNLAIQQADDSATPTIGGTLGYMAPEQLEAFASKADLEAVDARSDVYSLGVVLFELLTGKSPFGDIPKRRTLQETALALAEQRRVALPGPRQHCPEVPEVLDRVVRRCLDPEPQRRYQSAKELARALDGCGELCRAEKEMPLAGSLTRVAMGYPLCMGVLLALMPNLAAAGVNLGYHGVWLAGQFGERLLPLLLLALAYTTLVLLIVGWLTCSLDRPITSAMRGLEGMELLDDVRVARLRRQALRKPMWLLVVSGLCWLPGAGQLSWLSSEAFDWRVQVHFLLPFVLAGLVAMTYCALGAHFLMLRIHYPRLWVDARDVRQTASEELGHVQGQIQFMKLLAGLVPLTAGAAAMATLFGAGEGLGVVGHPGLQLLILVLLLLGMAACWLAEWISRDLEQTLRALLRNDEG